MGFLKFLFTGNSSDDFEPDFLKSEYDNWLDFLSSGGTDKQWNALKKENRWKFQKSRTEKFSEYQKELRPVFDQYSNLIQEIKSMWPILCNSKDYRGKRALEVEKRCIEAISYYKKIREIDLRHGQSPMKGSPAFTKLALLYERQKEYEKSIAVCKDALSIGIDESSRMLRIIKKSRRSITTEEEKLIETVTNSKKPLMKNTASQIRNKGENNADRKNMSSSKIDADQRVPASKSFVNEIHKKYYSDYPVKPLISKDRERNTDWINQAEMSPMQSIIPKSMMTRYPDGLLPGHIYMLYWIDKIHRKRIPAYFEYEFGIDFEKEKTFLIKHGYLSDDGKITEKGLSAISEHYDVVENKK